MSTYKNIDSHNDKFIKTIHSEKKHNKNTKAYEMQNLMSFVVYRIKFIFPYFYSLHFCFILCLVQLLFLQKMANILSSVIHTVYSTYVKYQIKALIHSHTCTFFILYMVRRFLLLLWDVVHQ